MRVIRDAPWRDVLVGADADVIDTDNVGHLFEALDVSIEAREEVPDAHRATGFGDVSGRWPAGPSVVSGIARDTSIAVCNNSRGVVATFDGLHHDVLSRVRDVADKAFPVSSCWLTLAQS